MKLLKACTALFISLFIIMIPKKIAWACGFYVAPGEYRFWLLQPDLTNQADLTPFFFASTYLYKGNQYAGTETHPQQNIEEWYLQTNKKANKEDIDQLLNGTDPQQFFDHPEQLAKENSLMRYVKQPQNKNLYNYLSLSKKVEQVATDTDPWNEKSFPKSNINNIVQEAKSLYATSHSHFVRLRTAFQLVRLYGYNQQYDSLTTIYDNWIAPKRSDSWIKTAALYQKAIHASGYESDYLLSKVFDKGGYNRSHCLVRFNSTGLDSVLKLARNQHERNVLYAMKVFNYPGRSLNYIRRIYRSEPTYKELPFLILREINKIEDWLVTNKVTDFGIPAVYGNTYWDNYNYLDNAAQNYRSDRRYAKEVYTFLQQIIGERKNRQQTLFRLYAAHLSMLEGNYTVSRQLLTAAGKDKRVTKNVSTQIAINNILLDLENGFKPQTERAFMNIINTPADQLGIYDVELMKDQLILYTARKMIQKGNKARGLMLLGKTNRALGEIGDFTYKNVYQEIETEANGVDYNQMLYLLDKRKKTGFEKFITSGYIGSPMNCYSYTDKDSLQWSRNKLLDCKASWQIRNYKLDSALVTLKSIPDSFWKQEPYSVYIGGDAFFVNKYHAHQTTGDSRWLNKKQVIAEMLRLEQLARKDKRKAAQCYFQLANAWYNMTYWGKNWLMVKQWWSANEIFGNNDLKRPIFNNDYFGCRKAREMYLKASRISIDKRLPALSYFMVEECDRNYRQYVSHDYEQYFTDKTKTDYNKLKQQGIDLTYYKQLVQECELYQSYISQYSTPL